MTQFKTIYQSGINSIAAYDNEGVITPASGLEEYFYVIFTQYPSDNETYSYFLANNVPFVIKEALVKTTGNGNNRKLFLFADTSPITLEQKFSDGATDFVLPLENIIIPTRSTIFIYNKKINIVDLRFVCKRVALLDPIIPVGNLQS